MKRLSSQAMSKFPLRTNDLPLESEKLDQLILEKYSASFMSNTKWEKLMKAMLDVVKYLHVSYKTVYSDKVTNTAFDTPDFTPFFEEPTLYKEIEWMEIPRCCENLLEGDGKVKKMLEQDLGLIEKAVREAGKFNMHVSMECLRVYAYT